MNNLVSLKFLSYCMLFIMLYACSPEGNLKSVNAQEDSYIERPKAEGSEPKDSITLPSAGEVSYIDPTLVYDGYILVNDAKANRVYLMNKNAGIVHEWSLNGKNIGNDAVLLPNGKLLASLESDDPKITFGGQGGKIQLIEKDGTVSWDFDYSSEDAETHHDIELLPNGNIIALVWEKYAKQEAENAGSKLGIDLYTEAIIEINPESNEIVWEWHAWDHLIQDYDETKKNYGQISNNPGRIDLNYVDNENGDIMHANGIAYDASHDLIFISVNFYHEVWAIDHSTTSKVAAQNSGGRFGKGGDLIYRFGNPKAYGNEKGERIFHNVHFPNLLDSRKMLIFSNGSKRGGEQSTVYELLFPEVLGIAPDLNNEPEINWSFADIELYSPKVSGAVRLPNNNILITEGDFGFWEVTRQGKVVWKFKSEGFFWRGYHFDKNSEAIKNLGLN